MGLLNHTSQTLRNSVFILMFSVFISRILGLLRDRFLAGAFGAGIELDIYFAAFRVPDLIYNVLFAGSIIVSFMPIFSAKFVEDEKEAWNVLNYVFNAFLVSLFALSLVCFIFTPQLIDWIVPGFDAAAKAQTVDLTRLMFLSPLFLGISSLFSSVLQFFNRFLIYSFAPLLYNLGIIMGILLLSDKFGVFGAGIGVVVGALLHFIIQIPAVYNCGYRYKPLFDFKNKAFIEFIKSNIPRTLAAAASQINFIVITLLASTIGAGALAVFNLSNNLRYLPIGIIGVSFATAIFPRLCKSCEDKKCYINSFLSTFSQVLYLTFPIGVLMFILREPIVRIILESGQFGEGDVALTSACLGIFCLSIFAQSLVPLLLRGFFSIKDSKTPTKIALLFVGLNIILSHLFIFFFQNYPLLSEAFKNMFGLQSMENISILGLCLAFNVGLLIEFVLLFKSFSKRIENYGLNEISDVFLKILASSAIMVLVSILIDNAFNFSNAFVEFLVVSIPAALSYLAATYILRLPQIHDIRTIIAENVSKKH